MRREEAPCLWLRGILARDHPRSERAPFLQDIYGSGCATPGFRDRGLLYTDGLGGEHGSIPHLRRCGVGIAHIVGAVCDWGLSIGLPGAEQTVPRALFAVLVVLTHARPGRNLLFARTPNLQRTFTTYGLKGTGGCIQRLRRTWTSGCAYNGHSGPERALPRYGGLRPTGQMYLGTSGNTTSGVWMLSGTPARTGWPTKGLWLRHLRCGTPPRSHRCWALRTKFRNDWLQSWAIGRKPFRGHINGLRQ